MSYFNLFAILGIETYAEREVARLKDNKIALSKFVKEILLINIISMVIAYSILFLIAINFWRNASSNFISMWIRLPLWKKTSRAAL